MRNFALVLVMFCALLGTLAWMAFTGVGATHSNAPPVVVDLGTHAQPFHRAQPQPEVSLKSEPIPLASAPQPPKVDQSAEQRPLGRPRRARSYSGTGRSNARPWRLVSGNSFDSGKASDRRVLARPSRSPAPRSAPKLEPAVHLTPSVPAAEHYAPTLNPGPERGRDLPIEVRKLPDASGPTQTSLEADREWRRKTLERWAREEAQSLSREVKKQQSQTRAKPPKPKKRSRHRLLFISW